jgi:hypothetical protein
MTRAGSLALRFAPAALRFAPAALLLAAAALLFAAAAPHAQQPAPPGEALATFAARRFPQPVRVGELKGRRVLEPVESRNVLGTVSGVVRRRDGALDVVVKYGGLWGWGGRPIAVPVEAMVLLGSELEILDFTPAQLDGFPTFAPGSAEPVAADAIIRMGLAHPSH